MAAGGGGGGAWKVAYADFVTAMMALFMVLWISAQDKKILIATSKYFQSPFSSPLTDHSGLMPFNKDSSNSSSESQDASGVNKPSDSDKQIQLSFLNSVAADFYRLLHLDQNLEEKPVDIQVTSDGLRITLFDRAKFPLFKGDTSEFSDWGRNMMQSLAWVVDRNKFRVTIDSHSRRIAEPIREDYTAWELSADRANATRRALVFYAVDNEQIDRVTGYADTRLQDATKPESDANDRITISLALTSRIKEKTARPAEASSPAAPAAPAAPPLAAAHPSS